MNILAVDFGTKNIGLAWSDTAMGMALPYGVIKNIDRVKAQQELIKMVSTERIDKVLVGLPYTMNGEDNNNTMKIRAWVEEIKTVLKVPVEFVDERFSSKQADRSEGGASRDEKSAMVILESYLQKSK